MRDAWGDLVLGSSCVGCGRPGRVLCPECARTLPQGGRPAWPTPAPAGLVPPFAGGEYDGLLKAMVNAHKEQQVLALVRPMGDLLAAVVRDLLDTTLACPRPVLLVPVPSRRATVRRRGHDPLLRVTRRAAARLRRAGGRAYVCALLRTVRTVRDQSGLDAVERAANLHDSMRCARELSGGGCPGVLVVVDDVLTTGSTAREAQRALTSAGRAPVGVAVLAATRLRTGKENGGSLPLWKAGG